ncbi:MAG: NAD+ synthase [Bacteroidales bacterium]
MQITLTQAAFYVNKISDNIKTIKKYLLQAKEEKSDILVLPAHSLCGFRPLDALKNAAYLKACDQAMRKLILASKELSTALIFDFPFLKNNNLYQRILFVQNGQIMAYHDKSILSAHSFLNEFAYFTEGKPSVPILYKGHQIVLCFAEEVLAKQLKTISPDLCICLDAYPFAYDTWQSRQANLMECAKDAQCDLVYVNQAGAHDQFIMQGASFVKRFTNAEIWKFPLLENKTESVNIYSVPKVPPTNSKVFLKEEESDIALIHRALVIGIRDYFKRCGAKTAIVGLSGGIDSALVLPLAVEALGRQNVFGVMMPSQFSSDHSVNDAIQSAENLQIYYDIIPIKPMYEAYMAQLQKSFEGTSFGLAEENIQARIRGGILMAMSNKFGHLLLNTSNKSESACGYGTLYGDLCGGLAVIGDLYKQQVYELAYHINRKKEIIPQNTISKPPSAELRPNQKDADSLPDYDILDGILRAHIEQGLDKAALLKCGYTKIAVEKTLRLLYANEYKRKQVPPALRISSTALGIDRIMPMIF